MSSAPFASEPPPELRVRVLEAIEREPIAPRVQGMRRRARIVALGFGVMVALTLAISMPKTRGRPLGYVQILVLVWTLIAVVATWAGVGRGRSMLGRPLHWQIATTLLTPVVLLMSWLPVTLHWPQTLADASTPFRHAGCILGTFVLAAGPLVAFFRLRRRSDPVRPWLTGAAIGTAAAAWGAMAMPLVCGFTSPAHMLFGHLLPVLLIAGLGAALGERLVAVRARTE
jgi:hypothetical protein